MYIITVETTKYNLEVIIMKYVRTFSIDGMSVKDRIFEIKSLAPYLAMGLGLIKKFDIFSALDVKLINTIQLGNGVVSYTSITSVGNKKALVTKCHLTRFESSIKMEFENMHVIDEE